MAKKKLVKPDKKKKAALLKLDLGCGQNPKEGFEGVDFYAPNPKHKVDLFKFPWPFDDNSVEEIHCSHFLEHVPNKVRFAFMDEVWRILIPGGKALMITPYWAGPRAIQDPTHEWPPICENSYFYFWKLWREQNKLDHYHVKCDFDFTYGYFLDPETASKNTETQSFWVKHYLNAISDMFVTLTKHTDETRKAATQGPKL